jgi:hypothetical protein
MRAAIIAKRGLPRHDCIGAQRVKTIKATDSRLCYQVVGQSWRERDIEILSCFNIAMAKVIAAALGRFVTNCRSGWEPPNQIKRAVTVA